MNEVKEKKVIKIRVGENVLSFLQNGAQSMHMSVNGYVNFVLNLYIKKPEIKFEEKVTTHEKKETRIRVCLTASEMELLRQYALVNNWSLVKEVRYRVIASLAKKPKLTDEELKAIYAVRSSINVLGVNVNRLVKDGTSITDENIKLCTNLLELMKELKDKINYLEKCSYSNFKLKKVESSDGS